MTLDLEKMAREFVAREIEVNANAIDVEDVIQLMMLFARSVQKASEEEGEKLVPDTNLTPMEECLMLLCQAAWEVGSSESQRLVKIMDLLVAYGKHYPLPYTGESRSDFRKRQAGRLRLLAEEEG